MAGRVFHLISLNFISVMSAVSNSRIRYCETVCLNTPMCTPSSHDLRAFTCHMKKHSTVGKGQDSDTPNPSVAYTTREMELKCVPIDRQASNWCKFERCIPEFKDAGATYNCNSSPDEQRRRKNAETDSTAALKRQPKGYMRVQAGDESIDIKLYRLSKTRPDALTYCREEGATLVKISTEGRNAAVMNILQQKDNIWLGLYDYYDNNTFYHCDGSPLTYANWRKGQPTHVSRSLKEDEDCVVVVKGFGWADEPCEKFILWFVCEIEKPMLQR